MPKTEGERAAHKRWKVRRKEREREEKRLGGHAPTVVQAVTRPATAAFASALRLPDFRSPALSAPRPVGCSGGGGGGGGCGAGGYDVRRSVGQLIELLRRAKLEEAWDLVRRKVVPFGRCVTVKEYVTLVLAVAPQAAIQEVLSVLRVLEPTVQFASQAIAIYFLRFFRWVVCEQFAEVASNLQMTGSVPRHILEQRGVCAANLLVQRGKGSVELELNGPLPFGHQLQKGDYVLVSFVPPPRGTRTQAWPERVDAEVMQMLPGGQGLKVKLLGVSGEQVAASGILSGGSTARVDKLGNRITYCRVLDALRAVASDNAKDAAEPQMRQLLTAEFVPDTPGGVECRLCSEAVTRMGMSLSSSRIWHGANHSQKQALVNSVQRRLTLIQGPPGSGKTHTAVMLVQLWVQAGCRPVLCTADSNVAVDNLVSGCIQAGLAAVRIGRPEATRPDLEKYNLEQIARAQLGVAGTPYDRDKNWRQEQNILKQASVVCATCSSAASAVLEEIQFANVLVDEAAQVTEPLTLVPLSRKGMQQVTLVGDHRQLPPVVICREAEVEGLGVPLFERLVGRGISPMMLGVQYRMHPALAVFPSGAFYGGELRSGVEGARRPPPEGFSWPVLQVPVAFVPVNGFEAAEGTSYHNGQEVSAVAKIIEGFMQKGLEAKDIAVISPYAAQVRVLRRQLGGTRLGESVTGLEVGSVDSFQGREKEVIIVSTVRANPHGAVGFLSDPRRLNVTLTRARRGLVVCGHLATLRRDSQCWGLWVAWALKCGVVRGEERQCEPQARSAIEDLGRQSVEELADGAEVSLTSRTSPGLASTSPAASSAAQKQQDEEEEAAAMAAVAALAAAVPAWNQAGIAFDAGGGGAAAPRPSQAPPSLKRPAEPARKGGAGLPAAKLARR